MSMLTLAFFFFYNVNLLLVFNKTKMTRALVSTSVQSPVDELTRALWMPLPQALRLWLSQLVDHMQS